MENQDINNAEEFRLEQEAVRAKGANWKQWGAVSFLGETGWTALVAKLISKRHHRNATAA